MSVLPVPRVVPAGALERHRWLVTLTMLGFALSVAAWVTVAAFGPRTGQWASLGPMGRAAVLVLPLVIGSLGRIPVGALADRFGARVVFAALCVASAAALVLFAFANTPSELVTAAVALGVPGTAFAAGAGVVVRATRPNGRGLGLGAFGAGLAGGAIVIGISPAVPGAAVRLLVLVLAGLLVVVGLLMAVTTGRGPEPDGGGPAWSEVRALLRLPATRQMSVLYAVAFAPHAATLLFLPGYLRTSYGDDWRQALPLTAALVAAAALARPLGAWIGRRRAPAAVLVTCMTTSGLAGIFLAFHPPQVPEGAVALAVVMVGLGLASGAILGYIGDTVPVDRAATIVGTIGAAGGVAALVPPAVLAAVYRGQHSFAVAVSLVSAALLLAAGYVFLRTRWVGGLLVFPGRADAVALAGTATTVVALTGRDTAAGGSAAVSRLAELATAHELVVVYAPGSHRAGLGPHALVTALRLRVERHTVVAIVVSPAPYVARTDLAIVADLVAEGALTVAVVHAKDPRPTADLIAAHLGADLVLRLDLDRAGRARLVHLAVRP